MSDNNNNKASAMIDFVNYINILSKDDKRLEDLLKAAMKEAGHTEVILADGSTEPL